jgi:hypothetical protein
MGTQFHLYDFLLSSIIKYNRKLTPLLKAIKGKMENEDGFAKKVNELV